MRLPGYYSSGQFADMADVSVRTIRFYDKQNILKPSYLTESGARFYTDSDFARLQQILLLKYLGFSLDEIREMTIGDADPSYMLSSLSMQQRLVEDRIEQLQLVQSAIRDTRVMLENQQDINWKKMLDLIHLTGMEKSMASQYRTATNLSARIRLHTLYSENSQGWFPWLFEQLSILPDMKILELGCGSGSLWLENRSRIPASAHIILSDISDGMMRDTRRSIGADDPRFDFDCFDCHKIPYADASFDLVIANHVLFYCDDIFAVCEEIRRVLKPGGVFACSTYSGRHMSEITRLVQEFDNRIVLSADALYERFGLENGASILAPHFSKVTLTRYEDGLKVTDPQPLVDYILSCHGNQNTYLLEHYKEFKDFVEKRMGDGLHITKDAGLFLCQV